MPAAPRPNKKAMKIAYDLLKTPKEKRQGTHNRPTIKTMEEWQRDSSTSQ